MKKLTLAEQRVFDCIVKSINENGYAPSIRDIKAQLGYKSTSTVHLYLSRLEKFGYIFKENGKSRAITLGSAYLPCDGRVPVIKRLAEDGVTCSFEDTDEYINFVPEKKYFSEKLFAIKVSDESMVGAGIMVGDYVVSTRCDSAEVGEIVVAIINGEISVKRLVKKDGQELFLSENGEREPARPDNITTIGRVISVVRYY